MHVVSFQQMQAVLLIRFVFSLLGFASQWEI